MCTCCEVVVAYYYTHNPLSKERFAGDAGLPSSNDIIIMSSHCTTVNNFLLILGLRKFNEAVPKYRFIPRCMLIYFYT